MRYIGIYKALYDYKAQQREEISFNLDNILYILDNSDPNWYKAQLKTPPEHAVGPVGLVPSNYIEKASPIGTVKALYPYTAQSVEEVSFEENEVLELFEKDDVNWYLVQKNNGPLGLVPSNYVEEQIQVPVAVTHEAVALFDFKAESKEETDLREHERILILDSTSSTDWWKIQHSDGSSGLVPAAYVQQTDPTDENKARDPLRETEQKELERQAEIERRRRLQEEKRQANSSPKRSDIPAPLPPSQHNDPTKPDPSKVRLWTDRTGAFKVEAQFLSCANGKIRLFKTNGVKIDVPTDRMCMEDLRYIEQETNSQLEAPFDWLEFFQRANVPPKACVEYAQTFKVNQLTEKDLERLTHQQMKLLGMAERHVQRIQRFMETGHAEPASDDEVARPLTKPKIKKSVTFGAVSYIEDHAYDDEWQHNEVFAHQENNEAHSLRRRGTGRPTPAHAAPKDINSTVLTPHKFNSAPLVPTQTTTNRFEDDAWAPRTGTSPAITPNSLQAQPSLVDPEMLAQWGGSPQLAHANTRPVPSLPAKETPFNRNQIPLHQLHSSSMPNLHTPPQLHQPQVSSVLPAPLVPQSSYLQPQMTGTNRSWTQATPDNPFGGSPLLQQVNPALTYQQPQMTGFNNQNQTHLDKYAVFKTLDSSSSSIFNQNNGQNRPFY
ncbi:hypothetical protein EDC96DRAFT_577544 [Choanephora cucurbitarum]|nr:hypothetical protein EDC96DRAFT_577544 [Choanephora cucurbitarum]